MLGKEVICTTEHWRPRHKVTSCDVLTLFIPVVSIQSRFDTSLFSESSCK